MGGERLLLCSCFMRDNVEWEGSEGGRDRSMLTWEKLSGESYLVGFTCKFSIS